MGIESKFKLNKAIGAGLAKEINALYNDGGHGRLTLPIGVCSAPSCWSPWAVSADRRHLQGVELSGEESGNLFQDDAFQSVPQWEIAPILKNKKWCYFSVAVWAWI